LTYCSHVFKRFCGTDWFGAVFEIAEYCSACGVKLEGDLEPCSFYEEEAGRRAPKVCGLLQSAHSPKSGHIYRRRNQV
jgi:hypothetical protein